MPGFVHLRVHSSFSLLEGALPLKRIIELALADGQPAIAVTDTANLFGALEFSEKAASAGLQPIVGCEIAVRLDGEERRPGEEGSPDGTIVLLAATAAGYGHLVRLISRMYLSGRADLSAPEDLLASLSEGVIALTGWRNGPLGTALARSRPEDARRRLGRLESIFGDRLYVEIQRHGAPDDAALEAATIDLAYEAGLPLVATNNAFFPARDDFEAHDALICVADGVRVSEVDRRRLTPEHHLKTREEMQSLFADLPEALESTVEIARRCSVRPRKAPPLLPRFAGGSEADALEAEARLLEEKATEGLQRRLAVGGPAAGVPESAYHERLAHELSIINAMKYPGYFLIVADFIQWAKAKRIPVGPGRGSGAGSLVAYALTITDLDPLAFGLLFERFLNPERVSMPDFDVDFCQERRDEVIAYVTRKYGEDRVAQIITFGTLQARAVLRDVGRVLDLPYGQVDRLCKLVPANPANPVTLGEAVEGEPRLREAIDADPVVGRLVSIARKLEGLYRHASTHAAGIVIGDRPLEELVPLYRDPRAQLPVTQFNMKWVENAGLVKFDFLGLKTLTVIQKAIDLLEARGIVVDLETLPLDDETTYAMLAKGETVGVFQLESQGMRKALVGMKPDRFEDIIALVALYRPGPMDNIPTYNRRKHGLEVPDYLHPMLEAVLKETYGVIIYQEQVMQIAQIMSGYSLGEADLLRRAMGKKIREEMAIQRVRFVDGAVENGVERSSAEHIFDLVAKFANYGFNKSHAAAYALVAYQTAFLKANYPIEFLAASMSLEFGNTDKINHFLQEARRLGIEVRAPDVQASGVDFLVHEQRILYALAAIKGVGRPLAEHLVALREERRFQGLEDFAARLDPRLVPKRGLEALVCAGALDCWENNRARLLAGLDALHAIALRKTEERAAGQADIFGERAELVRLPDVAPFTPTEALQKEHAALGFFMSAHPLDQYRSILERMNVRWWSTFAEGVKRGASAGRLAGTITHRTERRTRTGGRMGIVGVSDPSGQYEAVLFSETLAASRDLLEPGTSVLLYVHAEEREEGIGVRIQSVEALDDAAQREGRSLRIFVEDERPLGALERLLTGGGDAAVEVVLGLDGGKREVELNLGRHFRVTPPLVGAIRALPGVQHADLV